jgi:hypothetical protein
MVLPEKFIFIPSLNLWRKGFRKNMKFNGTTNLPRFLKNSFRLLIQQLTSGASRDIHTEDYGLTECWKFL